LGKVASPREILYNLEIVEDLNLLIYDEPIYPGCRLDKFLNLLVDKEKYLFYIYYQNKLKMLGTLVKCNREILFGLRLNSNNQSLLCKIEDAPTKLISLF